MNQTNTATLKDVPRIMSIKDFLTIREIEHLIDVSRPLLKRSMVVDGENGNAAANYFRTGQTAMLPKKHDPVVAAIEKRIAALTQARVEQLEFLNINRYDVGEEFKPHTDWFDPSAPQLEKQLKLGGQRVASVLVYLNKPEEGGETHFTELNLLIKPEIGTAIYWVNMMPDGKPTTQTMHCGKPIKKGEKWVLTCWVRERASDGSEEVAFAEQQRAEVNATESDKLKKQLQEVQTKNILEAKDEIDAILKRRKLRFLPKVYVTADGRLGAETYLESSE